MMNVKVTVRTAGLQGFDTTVQVKAADTVQDVCEKVSMAQLLGAFSEHELLLGEEPMEKQRTLASYGVTSESALGFRLEANELSVVGQLEDLLKGRGPGSLTADELALLYCYKYGLSVNAALKTLGLDMTLQQLVEAHPKQFQVDGKRVRATATADAAPTPAPAPMLFEKENAGNQKAKKAEPKKRKEPKEPKGLAIDEQAFQQLHTTISGRSFHSRAMQELRAVEHVLREQSFLDVQEVVRGGSVGRGTACLGCEDREVVFCVKGLPAEQHDKWLPVLYRAIASSLEAAGGDYPQPVRAHETKVTLGEQLTLRVAPHFASYAEAVQALGTEPPEGRPYFDCTFTKERTQFISKQPGSVKAVMRMLKWWREQQQWSCALTTPTDELLELVAVYVSQQCGKVGLGQQVSNCLGLLASLDKVRIVWSQFYAPQDAWAPLLLQRPLLMDPVNPFRNVLDPQDFDPRELMQHARTTAFW